MTEPAVRTLTIAGRRVEIRRVAGRAYFRASALFLHTFGKSLGAMISGAGIRVAQGELVTWAALTGMASRGEDGKMRPEALEVLAALVGAILSRFEDVDPDRLQALAEALIVGHVTIAGAEVTALGTIDALLPEPTAYTQLALAAIQHNLGPIFAGGRISDASSAATTSARPAATPSRRPR